MVSLEFFIDITLWPHYGPEVPSASNRNEYQEYFLGSKGGRCVQFTTLPPSCAECLEIWELQLPGTLRACPQPYRDCCTFYQWKLYFLKFFKKHNIETPSAISQALGLLCLRSFITLGLEVYTLLTRYPTCR